MAKRSPRPISAAQLLAREKRAESLAKAVGFLGRVEYRHVYSQTGGAQYGRGRTERVGWLTIDAEAFERDADPRGFSLEAIFAHERGHQILARHPRIAKRGRKNGTELIANDQDPPREVRFFHDLMQSYLTAEGLAAFHGQGYRDLPRTENDHSDRVWDASRVLLWTAADPKFTPAQSSILPTGGTDLFQMCLANNTFGTKERTCVFLFNELCDWAELHEDVLTKRVVLDCLVLADVRERLKSKRDLEALLKQAAEACMKADEESESMNALGTLYAGLAPAVYERREKNPPKTPESPSLQPAAVS